MSYRDFANDLKNGITSYALFFSGAEDFLMEWAADSVIEANVEDEFRSLDVSRLEGDQLTAGDIMAEARSYSMFSAKRVVIVRDFLPLYRKTADEGLEELIEFAGEPQDASVLVFMLSSGRSGELTAFGKRLAKACSHYEFARLEKAELRAFITKRLHAAGKLVSGRGLAHMIDVSGYYNRDSSYDLTQLDKDISKLVKASESDEISEALIEEILVGDSDRFVFNLVDALTAADRSRALSIAEAIIREEDGAMAVLSLLTKQFEIMYDALELSSGGMSISAMAKKTGVNEYRFKRAYNAAMRYSPSRIRKILTDLYNTDRDIKSGNVDKDTALELTAISACPR